MEKAQVLLRPRLIRSSAMIHPDASMHLLDSLAEFDFALKSEVINVRETSTILGVSRSEASQFYQRYQDTKNLLSTLYAFFTRNQIQQVLSNILNFY